MRRVVLIITFVFGLIAFTLNLPQGSDHTLFNGYFLNALGFLGEHFFLFLVGFVIVSFFMLRSLRIERLQPKKNHLLISLTQSLFVFITGIFLSFLLLLLLAYAELNTLAYIINLNPALLGIQTNINDISNSLKQFDLSPIVTATDNNHYRELLAIAQATTGTDSFYGEYILPAIPSFTVLPTGKIGSTILIDRTLIISSINKADLEKITPVVAYLFVKSYFPNRQIKHYPKVSIMNEAEYAKFRTEDYAKKFKGLNQQLELAKSLTASTAAAIQENQFNLTASKTLVESAYAQRDQAEIQCIAQGQYNQAGVFVHTNAKTYCDTQAQKFDQAIQTASDKVDFYTQELNKNGKLLKVYQAYVNVLNDESTLNNSLKVDIPLELGLFVPDDSIKIVLNTGNLHGIADYFETVTHEYLHYASSAQSGKTLSVALFEEGLTEYFARKIIMNSLNVNIDGGYPVYVKIISQITQMIPESELADYYFGKDEQGLENALNRVYGQNFYQDNVILFETLQYATDNKQLLKYANILMSKIGGKPLKESELISSSGE